MSARYYIRVKSALFNSTNKAREMGQGVLQQAKNPVVFIGVFNCKLDYKGIQTCTLTRRSVRF